MSDFASGAGLAAIAGIGIAVAVGAPITLPVLAGIAGGAIVVGCLVALFARKPARENETMRELEAHLKREEERKEAERAHERLRTMREERERIAVKMAEDERKLAMMEAELRRKSREKKMKLRQEAEALEEAKQKTGRLISEQRQREQQFMDEKNKLLEAARIIQERERTLQEEIERTQQIVDQERAARKRAENGLQPVRWPTMEEWQNGRKAVQYDENNFHFAIVGKAGSGKSSLINAFLNLSSKDEGAAPTGVTETTLTIGRYPDPGTQPPRPWTVWYDVPGAGTQSIPAWQYFINQGLFVFDIIIVAIGDRFEETDCQLLQDCHRFKIPAFIVRSKSDMHIRNLMQEEDPDLEDPDENLECYRSCRQTFITETVEMVSKELSKAGLPEQKVYLVSRRTLRTLYNGSLAGASFRSSRETIHERELIQDLMITAYQRRCAEGEAIPPELRELVSL